MTPLLQLQGAALRLGAQAFGPFNLSLAAGECVALLGPSGAGKSTLLKLMAGERAPASGTAALDGRPFGAWRNAALARRRAVLPQQHAVAFALAASLVVQLGRYAVEPDPARERITAAALAAAHAGHLAQRRFDTLSGGEQARVQLARTLAQLWDVEAGLLLVDEPLAALDPGLQLELLEVLRRFAQTRGHALVAIVHDLNQALGGFERLWLVQHGRLVHDLPADRHALPALARLFGVQLQAVDGDDGRVGVLVRRATAALPVREPAA
jgi:iron complex transport system ATP-binding protein